MPNLSLPSDAVKRTATPDSLPDASIGSSTPVHDSEPLRPLPWRSNGLTFVKDEDWDRPKPLWRRRPLDYGPADAIEDDALADRLNTYFEDAFDNNILVSLSDMAAAAGYESLSQMTNDARRKGPRRMKGIGRALLAVQAHYEELAQRGSTIALKILERIPSFDSREPLEQIATRAFQPQPQEHVVQVAGMKRLEDQGRELSPMDAYNQIIQKPSFVEIANAIDVKEDSDGVFGLPPIETES